MFDYVRSIIAGLLISIATFVSPVKQMSPTPPPKIIITITPKATVTISPMPKIIATQPPQAQNCQFNKDGFINKARELGYSEEEINTYLSAHPGNCINITKNTSVSQQVEDLENKIQNAEDCKKQMDQYTNCINQYNEDLKNYSDSLDPDSWRYGIYTLKPNNYCFKPACAY